MLVSVTRDDLQARSSASNDMRPATSGAALKTTAGDPGSLEHVECCQDCPHTVKFATQRRAELSAKTDFFCDGHPKETPPAVGAKWTGISYPVGEEKHHAQASPMVKIEAIGEAGHIAYHTIYRSDQVPGAFSGEVFCLSCRILLPRTRCPRAMSRCPQVDTVELALRG